MSVVRPDLIAELRELCHWDCAARVTSADARPCIYCDARARIAALEAALRPFAEMYESTDRDVARMADTCPVQWQYDMYGTQGLTLGDLKRAATALGGARRAPAESPDE